jgi:hypothetical protein
MAMSTNIDHRRSVVTAFCKECVWARSVRMHLEVLFESGKQRHKLLEESAYTFFGDLNIILIEYLFLQWCKLTDPASSGKDKDNLTTNYIMTLGWQPETAELLKIANDSMMQFRLKVIDARRKAIAHSDLKAKMNLATLGTFTNEEESLFWSSLQQFVDAVHQEAIGGPFEILAAMPEGDAASLVHSLIDAVDYSDLVKEESGFLVRRYEKRRYKDV